MKKSGRISAAAAVMGELMGIRPIITLIDGKTKVEAKVRGDDKVVPAMFDLFVTPLVSVFVTGYLTLAAIGPVFTKLENGIITGVQTLITLPYGIGSFIMGGLYAVTVVATLIDLGQLARYGYTYWLPLASAANVAQGGAALAVALKSKDTKVKSMALPSALSACMGITEPAIFGVNLRYFKPFIGGLLGGACGAWYASIVGLGATGTGVTGIFGILLHLHMPLQYIIMMAISFGVSFAVTWVIWSPEEVKA
jgi:PTS system sucrose-specific IIC component